MNGLLELAVEDGEKKLRERLQSLALTNSEMEISRTASATWLRNRLIARLATTEIASKLGKRCVISTVRERRGIRGSILHPIITSPPEASVYFNKPENSKDFVFNPDAYDAGMYVGPINDLTGGLYSIPHIFERESIAPLSFAARIKTFLSNDDGAAQLVKTGLLPQDDLQALRTKGTCIVFGRENKSADFTDRERKDGEFYYFLALYLVPEGKEEQPDLPVIEVTSQSVNDMFDALRVSQRSDKKDFARDGLQLVSDLVPALTHPEAAPSDAIRYFLEETKALLQKYTLGVDNQKQWVRFVAIDSPEDKDHVLSPSFHLLPHLDQVKDDPSVVSSFLLSHPQRLATTKLILKRWADKVGRTLSAEFNRLVSGAAEQICFVDTFNCGCLSQHDDEGLWARVNVDSGEDETRCTLGFVIERKTKERDDRDSREAIWPYAVVVFESNVPDAFSLEDAQKFRALVDACAELFIGLSVASVGFDLKEKVREAFKGVSALHEIGGRSFGLFRFEIMRLDKLALERLVDSDDQRIWDNGLSQAEAQEHLTPRLSFKGLKDEDAADKRGANPHRRYDEAIKDREKWVLEREREIHKAWAANPSIAEKIYQFLKYVPSHPVWHCYLSALPRAIAGRAGVGSKGAFQALQQHGGRSALAMFVFGHMGGNEFRQIIKLSDYQRIHDENEKYKRYVRYNVPLAARISEVRFEGDGKPSEERKPLGKMRQSTSSSGALVSDLIAAKPDGTTVTFLQRVIALIEKSASGIEIDKFREAIRYQFEENTARWLSRTEDESWTEKNVFGQVRLVTRFLVERDDGKINNALLQVREKCDGYIKTCLEKLARRHSDVDKVLGRVEKINRRTTSVYMEFEKLGAVVHGDLNGRNLVWSEDYSKFFMIDFEHVGVGFRGADQLRLMSSLLSDLVEESYLSESEHSVSENQIKKLDRVVADNESAMKYLAAVMKAIEEHDDDSVPIEPPKMKYAAVAEAAIATMLGSNLLKCGKVFWTTAITFAATKQLEYALRGIDGSCEPALKKIISKPNPNFYKCYTKRQRDDGEHDKFALAKIARVLFAYRTLETVLFPDEPASG